MSAAVIQKLQQSVGVFNKQYGDQSITVSLFESYSQKDPVVDDSVWQAVVTYKVINGKEEVVTKQELDTLTSKQRDYCRDTAVEMERANQAEPFGEAHLNYMAEVYWDLIK